MYAIGYGQGTLTDMSKSGQTGDSTDTTASGGWDRFFETLTKVTGQYIGSQIAYQDWREKNKEEFQQTLLMLQAQGQFVPQQAWGNGGGAQQQQQKPMPKWMWPAVGGGLGLVALLLILKK
jgi:hypothetical protein